MDPRTRKLARTIVRWSLKTAEKECISINSSLEAEPLCVALYEELLQVGAFPALRMQPERVSELLMTKGKPHHYDSLNPYDTAALKAVDGTIRILASGNTRGMAKVKPDRQARMAKAARGVRSKMLNKKWTLTLFPTAAYAQDAEMSLSEFEDFVYDATYASEDHPITAWKALYRRQEKLIGKIGKAKQVRIVGPGTELSLSIKGRTFMNSPGTNNMPSGEIYTGPVENSAEGHISYDYPVVNAGKEIDGIRLVFRKGKVVEASATKNEKYLLAMLDMDPGARRLGELGIGTNFNIQRFIKNILFDEKIGGSIHLALGASYPATGGVNKSALHWDMIKDLRKGGALYIDEVCVQKDGVFKRGYF